MDIESCFCTVWTQAGWGSPAVFQGPLLLIREWSDSSTQSLSHCSRPVLRLPDFQPMFSVLQLPAQTLCNGEEWVLVGHLWAVKAFVLENHEFHNPKLVSTFPALYENSLLSSLIDDLNECFNDRIHGCLWLISCFSGVSWISQIQLAFSWSHHHRSKEILFYIYNFQASFRRQLLMSYFTLLPLT